MEELIDDILHQMQRKLGSAQMKELRRVLVGTLSNRSNKEREGRRHGISWGGGSSLQRRRRGARKGPFCKAPRPRR